MLHIIADTLLLFVAASLNKPIQPVLDAYAAQTGTVIQRESGASLEHVRKITELHRIPDLLLLADAEVFPQLLVPKYATWYAEFARNRMVLAYTDRSKHAREITNANWMQIVQQGDVQVGRTDPDLAPVGYRTLLLFTLAEHYYNTPGLSASLLAHAPASNIRPNAAELAALLAAGELDYIYDYQSVAESNGFKFIRLPAAIDLGDPAQAANYATASVRVRGSTPGSKTEFKGQPILYGLSVPAGAPHSAAARRFLAYLSSPAVLARLRAAHVDMLDHPLVVGTGAPAELRGAIRR
jgi:molybdate/tungstate transport system substrate-binding protein